MELKKAVEILEDFAPTSLAESWDNVGLLVEPTQALEVRRVILTNDLTESVLDEAVAAGANLIVSYHPPIFTPLKRLTSCTAKERIVVRCIENRMAVYSPHTSYDAVAGGVNDWLAGGLGEGKVKPLHPVRESGCDFYVEAQLSHGPFSLLKSELETVRGATSVRVSESCASLICPENNLAECLEVFRSFKCKNLKITQLTKPFIGNAGMGRLCTLNTAVSLQHLVQRIKDFLKLQSVRIAFGTGKNPESGVRTVALCAGAGGSVLKGAIADVYLTGEMSHHQVLEAVSGGTSVILCEHSNTERGFLVLLKEKLEVLFGSSVSVLVSTVDKDPLETV